MLVQPYAGYGTCLISARPPARAEPGAVLLDVPLRIELLRREVSRLTAELGDLGQRVIDVKVAHRHRAASGQEAAARAAELYVLDTENR
jgi:hypothetical protein